MLSSIYSVPISSLCHLPIVQQCKAKSGMVPGGWVASGGRKKFPKNFIEDHSGAPEVFTQ